MARSRWHAVHSVATELANAGFRFSFVQAVRLLQLLRRGWPSKNGKVGYPTSPENESIVLEGQLGRSFPGCEIDHVVFSPDKEDRPIVSVAFMGIYGPCGVLPQFDNQRLIDAGSRANVEKELLDLFNHRLLSLYYRASTKYRVPIAFEGYVQDGSQEPDIVTRAILSIAGLGTSKLQRRNAFEDEIAIKFAQFIGASSRNAASLVQLISSVFGLPVSLRQFQGQWLELGQDSRSYMPSMARPLGQNCQLGMNLVIGSRVWDIQGKFRLVFGPLRLDEFRRFSSDSIELLRAQQLIRLYAGPAMDFEIQLALLASEVPQTVLDGAGSQLGMNSWLVSKTPSEDKYDAVFVSTGAQAS